MPPPASQAQKPLALWSRPGGVLALMSAVGTHKFILGKNTAGYIMLAVTLVGWFCAGLGPLVMMVIAIIEGIKYLKMSDAEFYETYVAGDKAWL